VGLPPDLPAGAYTVKYRVLSADGHVVEGSYRFTVKPGP
ncbi:MAG TPA: copper resistance protein CopC, partial [Thermodesulfobacteriota bacterium]